MLKATTVKIPAHIRLLLKLLSFNLLLFFCIRYLFYYFNKSTDTGNGYIPATVMGIIKANYTNKTFGISILKEQHPFVFFSADDKIGCIDDKGFTIIRH